jgi:hypothetical protein
MNRFFSIFCITRFGIGPLHNLSRRSDFDFKFAKIFVIDESGSAVCESGSRLLTFLKELCVGDMESRRLPASVSQGAFEKTSIFLT